jgi:membrane-bound lytic murein transglycosylase A
MLSHISTVSQSAAYHWLMRDRVRARSWSRGMITILLAAVISSTITAAPAEGLLKFRDSQFEPIKWGELAGWSADDHLAAFAAYQASCRALLKSRRSDEHEELSGALSIVCRKAAGLQPLHTGTARAFFEKNFQLLRIGRLGEATGLLTGYFEPVVAGSRFPSPEFSVPLYRRPHDLEAVGYRPGALAFPNKGVRIGRRNDKNELVPYYDRAAIEAGALDGRKLEICWLKSSSDLLTLQIEGSGRVILEDGTPLRVAFDSQNGYPFSSIERVLIDRNIIPRSEISTQRIRDWMATHPEEAAKVRAANRSYVFFRVTGLTNEGQPLGAQGVPLTPGRSIAVDRQHQYGTPFFIQAELKIEGSTAAFHRLMIAQDTGSAIVGPARADLYWGAGEQAARIAGRIHHPGRFVMLLPRELDLAATAREAPLPPPKPKFTELDAGEEDKGKVESRDTDRKAKAGLAGHRQLPPLQPNAKLAALDVDKRGKATLDVPKQDDKETVNSAHASARAAGQQKPSPAPNINIVVLAAEKQDSKRQTNGANAGASAIGKSIGLPVLNQKASAAAGKKAEAKGKGETVGASSTAIAADRYQSSSSRSSKSSDFEAKRQNVKGKAESTMVADTAAGGKHKASPAPTPKAAIADLLKRREAKPKPANGGADQIALRRRLPAIPTR